MERESILSLKTLANVNALQLYSLTAKTSGYIEVEDVALKQIYGGRLPDSNEIAVIIADPNTAGSRALTGAILNDVSTNFNIVVAEEGSSNSTVNQINA